MGFLCSQDFLYVKHVPMLSTKALVCFSPQDATSPLTWAPPTVAWGQMSPTRGNTDRTQHWETGPLSNKQTPQKWKKLLIIRYYEPNGKKLCACQATLNVAEKTY